jgi:putative transposase
MEAAIAGARGGRVWRDNFRPKTSGRNTQHNICPYLLHGLKIERTNPAGALDTTYVPMVRGCVYLTAVMDSTSHKVLAHWVAITLKATHAIEVLEETSVHDGRTDIVSIDQGRQFAAGAFTEAMFGRRIRRSMNGRGSCRDNVFVERVRRSIKNEEVYLKASELVSHARRSIANT